MQGDRVGNARRRGTLGEYTPHKLKRCDHNGGRHDCLAQTDDGAAHENPSQGVDRLVLWMLEHGRGDDQTCMVYLCMLT